MGNRGWCDSDGLWRRHTPCFGQVATAAAIYPFRLCKAIFQSLAEEMKARNRWDAAARLIMPPSHGYDDTDQNNVHDDEAQNVQIMQFVMIAVSSPLARS